MTEQGEVYKIDKKNRAIVRFPRTTACKNCNMCFKPRSEMFVEVTLENSLNAKVGDSVVVSMGKKAVLGASVIVYLVPVVLVGAILALTYNIDEVLSFVFAAVGFVVAETLIAVTDRLLRKKTEYMPKMVEILGRSTKTEFPEISEASDESEVSELEKDNIGFEEPAVIKIPEAKTEMIAGKKVTYFAERPTGLCAEAEETESTEEREIEETDSDSKRK